MPESVYNVPLIKLTLSFVYIVCVLALALSIRANLLQQCTYRVIVFPFSVWFASLFTLGLGTGTSSSSPDFRQLRFRGLAHMESWFRSLLHLTWFQSPFPDDLAGSKGRPSLQDSSTWTRPGTGEQGNEEECRKEGRGSKEGGGENEKEFSHLRAPFLSSHLDSSPQVPSSFVSSCLLLCPLIPSLPITSPRLVSSCLISYCLSSLVYLFILSLLFFPFVSPLWPRFSFCLVSYPILRSSLISMFISSLLFFPFVSSHFLFLILSRVILSPLVFSLGPSPHLSSCLFSSHLSSSHFVSSPLLSPILSSCL